VKLVSYKKRKSPDAARLLQSAVFDLKKDFAEKLKLCVFF